MAERDRIKQLMESHAFLPKKSRGQNFLIDDGILDRMVRSLAPKPDEVLLEVGPGWGSLTQRLLAAGARIVAIDVEPTFISFIRDLIPADRGEVIQGDATKSSVLRTAIETMRRWAPQQERFRMVGNLPYSVGTSILQSLFPMFQDISHATVLLQEEVAYRLRAKVDDQERGYLTLLTENIASVEHLFFVGGSSFMPQPKVRSSFIRLTFRDQPQIPPPLYAKFENVVHRAFLQKRKKMRNVLTEFRHFESDDATEAQRDLSRTLGDLRPVNLTLEHFQRIAESPRAHSDK